MIVLGIRTDKPQAELYLYDQFNKLSEIKWTAHLKLSATINRKIELILNNSSINYDGLQAVAVYKGLGSFTGLRIGISVANALGYALDVPIVAAGGNDWLNQSINLLNKGVNHKLAVPDYGSTAHVTSPRK